MQFVFDERKAAQAAAHLLQLHHGSMKYLVLIKLLYLSDRRSLVETGQPITGDFMVSMPHGPVLSMIYDRINTGQVGTPWSEYVSEPEHYAVRLQQANPERDELSDYEVEVLDKIHSRFGAMDQWALVDLLHTLPEWEDPHGSSLLIKPERILEAEGRSPEEIKEIAGNAQEMVFFSRLTGEHPN